MEPATREEVNELIDTIEELGWSVEEYNADEGPLFIKEGERVIAGVEFAANKNVKVRER